jgi:hypothetical protein
VRRNAPPPLPLQDDPLVKHCLDFIAVVASSVEATRQLAAGMHGEAAATLVAAAEQGAAELAPALAATAPAVVEAASASEDLRIRAVALRTLYALLCSPCADAQVRAQVARPPLPAALGCGTCQRVPAVIVADREPGRCAPPTAPCRC